MKKLIILGGGALLLWYYFGKNKKATGTGTTPTNGNGTTPAPAGTNSYPFEGMFFFNKAGNSFFMLNGMIFYDSDAQVTKQLYSQGYNKNYPNIVDDDTINYLMDNFFGGETKNIGQTRADGVKFQPLNDAEAQMYVNVNSDLKDLLGKPHPNGGTYDLRWAKMHWAGWGYKEGRQVRYTR